MACVLCLSFLIQYILDDRKRLILICFCLGSTLLWLCDFLFIRFIY